MLVNIATGSEHHKQSIMKRHGILRSILGLMSHESADVRVATIWVIINLTWQDEKGSSTSFTSSSLHDRITILRSMGIEERLRTMNSDLDLDVRDRVKTALHQFAADQQQQNQHHHAHTHGRGHTVAPSDAGTTGGPHGRLLVQNTSQLRQQQQGGHNDAQESTDMVTDPSEFSESTATTSNAAQQTIAGSGMSNHERR